MTKTRHKPERHGVRLYHHIDALRLPALARRTLLAERINRVGDLLRFRNAQHLRSEVLCCGIVSARQVGAALQAVGLDFGMALSDVPVDERRAYEHQPASRVRPQVGCSVRDQMESLVQRRKELSEHAMDELTEIAKRLLADRRGDVSGH